MKKIVIGATEIEVQSLAPFVYDSGRGEKVLRITVDETVADFGTLKSLLDGNEEPIQYFEDDALKCEYVGYTKFTATYPGGVYKVELHMASMETQMLLVMASNERITGENARITAENETLAGVVAALQGENADIKAENSALADAVAGLQKENADLQNQIDNIEVSGSGEADAIINTMLGLEG